jgi:SNF2 family DNA or RNA helicase
MFNVKQALCGWLLAGTPIQNDLSEFHAVFDLACPGLLGDLKAFNRTYEGPIQRGRDADATEKQVNRASMVHALHA